MEGPQQECGQVVSTVKVEVAVESPGPRGLFQCLVDNERPSLVLVAHTVVRVLKETRLDSRPVGLTRCSSRHRRRGYAPHVPRRAETRVLSTRWKVPAGRRTDVRLSQGEGSVVVTCLLHGSPLTYWLSVTTQGNDFPLLPSPPKSSTFRRVQPP